MQLIEAMQADINFTDNSHFLFEPNQTQLTAQILNQTNQFMNFTSDNPLFNLPQQDYIDPHELSIIQDRKQRRMISNRESARRSRMRKQKHLHELWSQVVRLRNENNQLVNKLNRVMESHENAVNENCKLKEEVCELKQMVADMQIKSPYSSFRELDDLPTSPNFLDLA